MYTCAPWALGLLLAAPDPTSETVVKLRYQVDAAATELAATRQANLDQLRTMRRRRDALKLRVQTLRSEIAAARSTQSEASHVSQEALSAWRPPLLASFEQAEAFVTSGIPFQTTERLALLHKARSSLVQTPSDPVRAFELLRQFLEEEEVLSNRVGLATQSIQLGKERMLAEIAHIGRALLYFQTPGGRVGWATPAADGQWRYEELDGQIAQQIAKLFDRFRNNQKLGPAVLALPADVAP